MIKAAYTIIFLLVLFGCNSKVESPRLLVDAGFFLDSIQQQQIGKRLDQISNKGIYKLYLYTVINEKYYEHRHYGEYVFDVIRKEKKGNNSVLLYLSYDDGKILIRTGSQVRTYLSDSLCIEVIERIKPAFRKREFYEGIITAIGTIDSILLNTKNE